jgi:hypothetical protein
MKPFTMAWPDEREVAVGYGQLPMSHGHCWEERREYGGQGDRSPGSSQLKLLQLLVNW